MLFSLSESYSGYLESGILSCHVLTQCDCDSMTMRFFLQHVTRIVISNTHILFFFVLGSLNEETETRCDLYVLFFSFRGYVNFIIEIVAFAFLGHNYGPLADCRTEVFARKVAKSFAIPQIVISKLMLKKQLVCLLILRKRSHFFPPEHQATVRLVFWVQVQRNTSAKLPPVPVHSRNGEVPPKQQICW